MPSDERITFTCSIWRSVGLAVDVVADKQIGVDLVTRADVSLDVAGRVLVEVEL